MVVPCFAAAPESGWRPGCGCWWPCTPQAPLLHWLQAPPSPGHSPSLSLRWLSVPIHLPLTPRISADMSPSPPAGLQKDLPELSCVWAASWCCGCCSGPVLSSASEPLLGSQISPYPVPLSSPFLLPTTPVTGRYNVGCLLSTSAARSALTRADSCVLFSRLYPRLLEQCLARSKRLIHICE